MGVSAKLFLFLAATWLLRGDLAVPGSDCLGTVVRLAALGDTRALQRETERCTQLAKHDHSLPAALGAARGRLELKQYAVLPGLLAPFQDLEDPHVLWYLAYADARAGNKQAAIARYRRALEISREWKDPIRELAAKHLASEAITILDYETAVRTLDWLLRNPGARLDPLTFPEARALLVRALFRFGDFTAAERVLSRTDWPGAQADRHDDLLSLLTEGQLRTELGQYASAAEILGRLRVAARRKNDRVYEIAAVSNLARIAVDQRKWSAARALIAEARALLTWNFPESERDLALRDGIAARESGDLDAALGQLQMAASRAPQAGTDWRVHFELGRVYEALGQPGVALERYEQSMREIEEQRRSLREVGVQSQLSALRRGPFEAVFDLKAVRGDAPGALAAMERLMAFQLTDQVATQAAASASEPLLSIERGKALRALVTAQQQVEEAMPGPAIGLPPTGLGVVAFYEARGGVWRWAARDRRRSLDRLAGSADELCSLARRFTQSVDDDALAERLGRWLLPPATTSLLGERFIVVPLHCAPDLPFAALRVEGRRLVERHVVSLAPNLRVATRPSPAGEGPASSGALAIGDPLGNLPAAREEARQVASRTGAALALGSEATLGTVLSSVPRQLLHLATHTAIGAGGPVLVLADGSLTIEAVLQAKAAPELVALASCRSGAGAATSGGETFAQAFLRAGSRDVLATMTSVEDQFASEVVRQFYAAGGVHDPAGALAHVQRELLGSEPPRRWAAFFVAGGVLPLGGGRPSRGAEQGVLATH